MPMSLSPRPERLRMTKGTGREDPPSAIGGPSERSFAMRSMRLGDSSAKVWSLVSSNLHRPPWSMECGSQMTRRPAATSTGSNG